MTIILVHGGAGGAGPERRDPALLAAVRLGLAQACAAGQRRLRAGASALDAVAAAVEVLEDDPVFNAGRGCALTRDGTVELDAAIMDGASGAAGAVTGVGVLRSPVLAARLVMERSGHVLLHGAGAEAFALGMGAERIDPSWFVTARARADLAAWQAAEAAAMRGTVGAVALDAAGRLAAATSTGGLTGKRPGRTGDCPVIGAGTWADARVAVSATGDGEAFLRAHFAGRVALLVEHGRGVAAAADDGLELVRQRGGTGGCIALAADRTWAMPVTTTALRRGLAIDGEPPRVAVFPEDELTPV